MRYRTKITTLCVVLAVLTGLYIIGLAVRSTTAELPLLFPRADLSRASSIAIGYQRTTIDLSRGAGGEWSLTLEGGRYPADPSKIAPLLSDLAALRAVRVASSSAASWPQFGVDRADGATVVVREGAKVLADLTVGMAGTVGDYVRRAGDSRVYESTRFLGPLVHADTAYWSLLRILPADLSLDSLQSIGVRANGFAVGGDRVTADYLLVASVKNGRPEWVVHDDPAFRLDHRKLVAAAAEIIRLEADQFVPHAATAVTSLDHPIATIYVSDFNGRHWLVDVGERDGTDFYAKREDRPYVYLVNEWTLHRAIQPLDALGSP